MDTALDQARTAFLSGIEHFGQRRYVQAEAAFEAALKLVPGRPSVLQNLGMTKVHLGQYEAAMPLLRAALAADDSLRDAWDALGSAEMATEQWTAAAFSHRRALELGPESAVLRLRLASCLAQAGALAEAIAAYRQALATDPGLIDGWSELGHALREQRQLDEAATCYRKAIALGADAEEHRYFLAALQSGTEGAAVPDAPRDYVKSLFDRYADDFDHHLIDKLGYRGHQMLIERLPAECPPRFARVLDLGCGTGLCGALVRDRADHLTGIDLSGGMVEKARARGIYDRLVAADLVDYLHLDQTPSDLVLLADVLIYVGHLERLFERLGERIAAGGWLAFSVEENRNGQDLQLLPSLRYAHSESYLRRLAAAHGLEWFANHALTLRFDQNQPIAGLCVFLRKS